MPKKKSKSGSTRALKKYILNCRPSVQQEDDWTFSDAIHAGVIDGNQPLPARKDLRAPWWKIMDQGNTGACVGFATAYGVLWWHYVQKGLCTKTDPPSARFIWMANKETDELTSYPSTFLDADGTQTKLALKVARKYGCVSDKLLPMNLRGGLNKLSAQQFYTLAARLRIASFHQIRKNGAPLDVESLKRWLAFEGPVLTRLNVEKTWFQAKSTKGHLETYDHNSVRGGHAVAIVGYTPDHFIIRNSWSPQGWGDRGFGYASYAYTSDAFNEMYGAIL